jgi:hypothetical protein
MEKVGSACVGVDSSQADELIAKLDEALGKAEALGGVARFPTDADGIPIRPGDDIHLSHNNRDRHVVSMTLCEDGTWLVHCDSGGGFSMPDSKGYVTHVKSDEERMFEANVAKNNEILRLLRENARLRDLARAAREGGANMGARDAMVTVHHKRREFDRVDPVDGNTAYFRTVDECEKVPARVWPVAMGADELLVEWEDGALGAVKLGDIRLGVMKDGE